MDLNKIIAEGFASARLEEERVSKTPLVVLREGKGENARYYMVRLGRIHACEFQGRKEIIYSYGQLYRDGSNIRFASEDLIQKAEEIQRQIEELRKAYNKLLKEAFYYLQIVPWKDILDAREKVAVK